MIEQELEAAQEDAQKSMRFAWLSWWHVVLPLVVTVMGAVEVTGFSLEEFLMRESWARSQPVEGDDLVALTFITSLIIAAPVGLAVFGGGKP